MDREIPVANRFISRKIQEFKDKKHQQTLSQIKRKNKSLFSESMYNETPKNSRFNPAVLESKNLQIEKQNICLFNKIASIIREKPRISVGKSHAQLLEEAMEKQKKKQNRLKTDNNLFEKRVSQQKSTIQNKLLFKDRQRNLKYLKFIGRYPYENQKKTDENQLENHKSLRSMRSLSDANFSMTDVEVYRKKTQEFFVKITKISNSYYVFSVEVQNNEKVFQYTMPKNVFDDQFSKSGYNYDNLVGKLRLGKNSKMIFDYE